MKHEILKLQMKDVLYEEGDETRTMYLLKQGRAQLYNTVNENEIEGMTVFSGGVLGELSFFDGLPRESSAKALMKCTLIAIKSEDMKSQVGAIPPWFTTIINSIVSRVRNTEVNVLKIASKGAAVDYSKKDLKSDSYEYMDKKDFLKIAAILSMVTAKYSTHGVNSLDINYEAFKQFIVRFQLGTAKMDEAIKILVQNEMAKIEDLGEGKTKFEILNVNILDSLIKGLMKGDSGVKLTPDGVRALCSLNEYFKDEPAGESGRKKANVVSLQQTVLSQERYFLRQAAFQLLSKAGFIKPDSPGEKVSGFSFDPKEVAAFIPAQKIISSIEALNKEH